MPFQLIAPSTDKRIKRHPNRLLTASLALVLLALSNCSFMDSDSARTWHAFRSSGEAAILKDDWGGAKTSFESALKEVDRLPNESMRVAISLRDLSSVCLHESDSKLADRLARRSLQLADEPALDGSGPNARFTQRELGLALNNLGDYYLKQVKDFDQSVLLYSKAETLFEGLVRRNTTGLDCLSGYHLANSLTGLGRAYAALQKQKEAAEVYDKALDPELLPAIPEVARRQLVTACAELPQLSPAETTAYAKKCNININEKVVPEDMSHQHLARARQLIRLEQLVAARDELLQAEKIAEGLPQPSHQLAEVLQTLGIVYIKQMDFVAAESVLLRAVGIFEKLKNNNPWALTECLFTLGTMYVRASQPEKAEPYALRRRALWLEANGSSDVNTVKANLFVAEVYLQEKKFDLAGKYYGEAVDGLQKSSLPDPRLLARAQTGVAAVYIEKGNYTAAKPLLEKARDFWRTHYVTDPGSAETTESLYNEVKQHLGISSR